MNIVNSDYLQPFSVILSTIAIILLRWLFYKKNQKAIPFKLDILYILLIIFIAGFTMFNMGRNLTYKYGPIRLWSENIWSNQNSQQIADPYTFTHFIHGAAFYAILKLIIPQAYLGTKMIIAVSLEAAWEIFENTDTVINRYREETLSLDYYGDSVINSIFDIIAATIGFILAAKLPTRFTILWITAIEVLLLIFIRDNLTLNILMLIYPSEIIKNWQLKGWGLIPK
jgi:hypothetical protein